MNAQVEAIFADYCGDLCDVVNNWNNDSTDCALSLIQGESQMAA